MIKLAPQQLADLWYLRFGARWVERRKLDAVWDDFYRTLKRTGYMDYEAISDPNTFGYIEVARLKGEQDADCRQ